MILIKFAYTILLTTIFVQFGINPNKFSSIILIEHIYNKSSHLSFDEKIIHYFKDDIILYHTFKDVYSPTQEYQMGNESTKDSIFLLPTFNLKKYEIKYIKETFYMRYKEEEKAVWFEKAPPVEKGWKPFSDIIKVVDFEKATSYKNNLGLGYIMSVISKKLIKSVHSQEMTWTDTYIMPENSSNKIDSVIITYDSRLKNIPFSFSPDLDKIHNSKVNSLHVVYHSKSQRRDDESYDYYFEIKENPIGNPQKIDSIFAKLIPYLPK